jgi:hypothetical protein
MPIAQYVPRLRDWRNELVAWLGIIATIAAQVAASLDGVDVANLEHWVALVPALVGIVGRNLAFGPRTVAALDAERVELLERIIALEAPHADPTTPAGGLTTAAFDEALDGALAGFLDDEGDRP